MYILSIHNIHVYVVCIQYALMYVPTVHERYVRIYVCTVCGMYESMYMYVSVCPYSCILRTHVCMYRDLGGVAKLSSQSFSSLVAEIQLGLLLLLLPSTYIPASSSSSSQSSSSLPPREAVSTLPA